MRGAAIKNVQDARGDTHENGFRYILNMYGLPPDRYLGPADGLPTTDHLQQMRDWCVGQHHSHAQATLCLCVWATHWNAFIRPQ
ncbi:unnamed protein product [Vitrella brassicaformis CCMP3155]|uniref:Uncharacterized protein n=1 Tax=Vitrella brassicaformis (strain CCMP3155) TaxID=1169540 RepID=A0A0G4GMJ4_VITBC|nr:unnamed protein product [Vitrella brassicaformis CCMP3155]|eukprot:CEM31414.1 unnamed protein product [Vitrella brassicaformis CCMP3155]